MATTSLTNTNISDTYTGVLHAKGEPIPASGVQDVYDGFGNKSSLKIGRAGVEVRGTFSVDKLVVGEESQDHWYFEDESSVFYLRQKTGSTVNTALTFDTARKVTLAVQGTADKHLIDKKYVDDQLADQFSASTAQLAEKGYQKLPSGLIMQWGVSERTTARQEDEEITFPLAFPTACLNVVAIADRLTFKSGNLSLYLKGFTTTTATFVYDSDTANYESTAVRWQAYGY
tara:strand:- start:313 stop:1002 length:690 start_codon:yes stop_codon:yes gene_type:complete